MAITYFFFDAVQSGGTYDRVYSADDFTAYLADAVGNGVVQSPNDNKLGVARVSGLKIKVPSGQAFINGCKIVNSANINFTLSAADATYSRYDLVYAWLDKATRTMGIDVREGTPAASPASPTYTANELPLARVLVRAGVTSLAASDIKDARGVLTGDFGVCPWIIPTGELKGIIDGNTADIASLRTTVTAQGNQLTQTTNKANSNTTSIAGLTTTVNSHGASITQLNSAVASLTPAVATLSGLIQGVKAYSTTAGRRYTYIKVDESDKYQGTALFMTTNNNLYFIRFNGASSNWTRLVGTIDIAVNWNATTAEYRIDDADSSTIPTIILGGRVVNSTLEFSNTYR